MSHLGTDPRLPIDPPAGYVQRLVVRLYDLFRQLMIEITRLSDGFLFSTQSVTSATTLTRGDSICLVNTSGGAVTITLPLAKDCKDKRITVKKTDATVFHITVDAQGAELIDDAGTAVLSFPYESICLVSDGANWWVI